MQTQWRLSTHNSRIEVIDAAYNPVCKMSMRTDDRTLAEHIVLSVNTHERAKSVLKEANEFIKASEHDMYEGQPPVKSRCNIDSFHDMRLKLETLLTDMGG